MKKILLCILSIMCFIGATLYSIDSYATTYEYVTIYIDCGGRNSVHTTNSFDVIHGEDRALVGSTVSSVWNMDEDPTSIDQDFVGWYVYDATSGAQIPGTGLLTTAQANSFVIPNHSIKLVAQWTPREGYPINNIAYAVFWNGEGELCYDVKVSIIYGDTCYSGYGGVSIPESIYSTWSGKIIHRYEPMNGVYIMYDGKWTNEAHEYEGSVRALKKHRDQYNSVNATGKGKEVISSRKKVNDGFYKLSFVAPEISIINNQSADKVISNTSIVPSTYTISTETYQSGISYDTAINAAKHTYGTNNVVVVDIALKDENGGNVSQLSDYVDVRVDIPSTYVVQPGNTVVVNYLNDQGELEECETTYHDEDPNNRYVTFKTNHFSVYVLVETVVKVVEEVPPVLEEEVQTEESNEASEDDSVVSEEESKEEQVIEEPKVEESRIEESKVEETEDESAKQESNKGVELEKKSEETSLIWLYLLVGMTLIVIIFVVVFAFRRRKKHKNMD